MAQCFRQNMQHQIEAFRNKHNVDICSSVGLLQRQTAWIQISKPPHHYGVCFFSRPSKESAAACVQRVWTTYAWMLERSIGNAGQAFVMVVAEPSVAIGASPMPHGNFQETHIINMMRLCLTLNVLGRSNCCCCPMRRLLFGGDPATWMQSPLLSNTMTHSQTSRIWLGI